MDEAAAMSAHGITYADPTIDIDKLRTWKDGVVKQLTGGLSGLAKQRKVQVVRGVGQFLDPNHVEVTAEDGTKTTVHFEKAIIAAGSAVGRRLINEMQVPPASGKLNRTSSMNCRIR